MRHAFGPLTPCEARREKTVIAFSDLGMTRPFVRAGERSRAYVRVLDRYRGAPVFSTAHPPRPVLPVTVLVPTLNEEDYVEDACRSLREQTLVRRHRSQVEILLVDSGSTDATRRMARPFVDGVVDAPRGKLTALVAGVRAARGGLIVEADADGWYPPSWLAEMVASFADPATVGVRGEFIYYDSPVLRASSKLIRRTLAAAGNFPGGVRAYRRSAFLSSGGFRTSIDQQDFWQVWPEEEFRFRRRLEGYGRVVNNRDALCFKSARRGDPVFVRDPRADRFRYTLGETGRFRDGITDTIWKARKFLSGRLG